MAQNSITVIKPYKWESQWVFDDDSVDLVKEPFVSGADTLIDIAVDHKGIVGAESGFLLFFSATPFPSADLKLSWVREEDGGNVYCWEDEDREGWLCPALLKYFEKAPQELHVQLKEASA